MDLHCPLLLFFAIENCLLAFKEQKEGILACREKLEGYSSGQGPEGYDFVHAGLVVYLNPGLFITNCDIALSSDGQPLQESGNAQVGVEILGLSFEGDRVDISELITNEDGVGLVVREAL